jgi:hypothetical protein
MNMGRPGSALPESAWRVLTRLDPETEDAVVTLSACLAITEQRFQALFQEVLPRFAERDAGDDLGAEADVLADAHHSLTLLQDSLHAASRRMLDVLDRVSRELGE